MWGADIHTIELCDFTVIYFERWDHVENMSVSLKGSNSPFSGMSASQQPMYLP